ncbi:hypothetical protein Hamer_G001621 [Homarus americanus]|uniref:Uncharacterized protein n=1 Tax=Homarus americanus TaxID=6706 RepID=A0A8J5JSU5_HOMAM|nr:hypothetical protein Hamer_G001621 [Homarus americanus]
MSNMFLVLPIKVTQAASPLQAWVRAAHVSSSCQFSGTRRASLPPVYTLSLRPAVMQADGHPLGPWLPPTAHTCAHMHQEHVHVSEFMQPPLCYG